MWLPLGTIIHTITQQNLHADYYYTNNVYDTTLSHFCGAAFDVKPADWPVHIRKSIVLPARFNG